MDFKFGTKYLMYIYLVGVDSLSSLVKHLTANQYDITLYDHIVSYLDGTSFRCIPPPELHLVSVLFS